MIDDWLEILGLRNIVVHVVLVLLLFPKNTYMDGIARRYGKTVLLARSYVTKQRGYNF